MPRVRSKKGVAVRRQRSGYDLGIPRARPTQPASRPNPTMSRRGASAQRGPVAGGRSSPYVANIREKGLARRMDPWSRSDLGGDHPGPPRRGPRRRPGALARAPVSPCRTVHSDRGKRDRSGSRHPARGGRRGAPRGDARGLRRRRGIAGVRWHRRRPGRPGEGQRTCSAIYPRAYSAVVRIKVRGKTWRGRSCPLPTSS